MASVIELKCTVPLSITPTADRSKQVAVLPHRRRGNKIELLLITSRETKRWVIPKGWTMKGKKDWEAAATEAFEEAGIKGDVGHKTIGLYHYVKRGKLNNFDCEVAVYPMTVDRMLSVWPEKEQRERKWFAASRAAELVNEDGLRTIIRAAFLG